MGEVINIGPTKIVIGIPSGDMVHADFAIALSMLVAYTTEMVKDAKIISIVNVKSSIIEKGRHEIVEAALNLNADKVLFLDTDMVFPPDTLKALFEANKDIVGCNYVTRRRPFHPTCRELSKKFIPLFINGVIEVGYIGTGCLLVSTEVFKKIGKPYFRVEWSELAECFNGEDHLFCEDARTLGFKVHCEGRLSREILHLGQMETRL